MKSKIWWSAFFAVLLLVSNAAAEVYEVGPGDSLSRIAKRHGVTIGAIQSVNPKIKNINRIQIGWKLIIPVESKNVILKGKGKVRKSGSKKIKVAKSMAPVDVYVPGQVGIRQGVYSKPGSAPTKMSNNKAWSMLLLNDSIKEKLSVAVLADKGINSFIEPRDQFLMTYGSDGVLDSTFGYNGSLYAIQYLIEDGGRIYDIRFISWCKNWTRYPEKTPPVVSPPVTEVSPPIELIIPPIVKNPPKETCVDCDKWDWYIGAGNYQNRIQGDDNHGEYRWMKFRYRPICIEPEKNSLGIRQIGLGGFGFLAGGDGIAAKYYDYDWHEAIIGATAKIEAEHSDYDIDLGIGKLWNEGSWMGVEDRDQIDDVFLASAHANIYRDDPEALWFRKYELNVEYRHPFHTRLDKGQSATDNRVFEANYTQWIYAAEIGDNKSLVVSPGFNFGLGYEWSSDDESFIKIGPAFEIASYDKVIAGISVFNYKFQGDGQKHPIGGYVSFDGIYNAWKAAHITGVSEEDLWGLQGSESKLLKNPADFL